MPTNFGSTPYSSETLPANTFPVSAVFVPGTANGNLTAVQGGPASTDGNGYASSPAAVYTPDGNDIAQGATTDTANANTVIGQLKQIKTNTASITVGSLPALPAGTNVIGHVIVDSAGNVSITSLPSLPAGTNVIGHVIVDSGSISVGNFPATQPVSGTVTANQGGTWNITNVSGAVSLPTGAATSAKQPALGTAGSASTDVLTVQGITSMTPLKVDNSGVTQPTNMSQIGGTNVVTGGASGLLAIGGPVASGASNADNPVKTGGVYNSTQPTVTTGQMVDAQYTARGAAIVATGTDALNATINAVTAGLSQANQVPVSNAGQQGQLTITGTLSANSDNSLTFSGNSTVARRIRIQNESSGVVYWALDATASAGSPSLINPGANAVSVEWINMACTTLHIFIPSGGTTTLNGSGGVKVTAWA